MLLGLCKQLPFQSAGQERAKTRAYLHSRITVFWFRLIARGSGSLRVGAMAEMLQRILMIKDAAELE